MKLYKSLSTALKDREDVLALKLTLKEALPLEIFDLENLEEVYLDGAVQGFPDQFTGWQKVKTLAIKWESFKGDLSPLFGLPKLQNLKIVETPIDTFRLPLGHVSAPLTSLTVKGCGLKKLPEEISMLNGLLELHLGGNELEELPFAFRELQKLKRLNLDQNNFKNFPDFFKQMKTLGHLSIDGNKFSEDEKSRIQREFHIWPN